MLACQQRHVIDYGQIRPPGSRVKLLQDVTFVPTDVQVTA